MENSKMLKKAALLLAVAALTSIEFLAHRAVPFMMDDLWYGTNLVTGEPLRGFSDIVESMVWHFNNWGGRCMTHGILQLTLMSGEVCADILNVLATLLLTWMVCVVTDRKNISVFLMVHAMLFAFNANLRMSMLWQAGTANYVYSSVWILLFLWPYLRALKDSAAKQLPLAALWLIPVGILAGWSNENIGPACFLIAVGTIVYLRKWQKKPVCPWMCVGAVCSLAGSVMVVAAPGNFVRSAVLEKQTFYDRFYSMLTAGADFLFPSFLLAVALLLVKAVWMKIKISQVEWALAAAVVLSYGAMVLSPHYPDRATFGTMVLCIALAVIALGDMAEKKREVKPFIGAMTICLWICAAGSLLLELNP